MTWIRGLNNGNASDAQVVVGVTNVIWAIGKGNSFVAEPHPAMGSTPVRLVDCSIPLGAGMSVTYKTLPHNLMEFTVTLVGTCGWYVAPQ